MDRKAIMEMLNEYGINSEAELKKAMKRMPSVNIGIFVATPNSCGSNDILIRKEDHNER